MVLEIFSCNLWSVGQYSRKLALLGYKSATVRRVGASVFRGWVFLPPRLLTHLNYKIIVACKPAAADAPLRRRVAIIGSEIAGLSAAHYLLTFKGAAKLDVRNLQGPRLSEPGGPHRQHRNAAY